MRLLWAAVLCLLSAPAVRAQCLGDFNGDGKVAINEIILSVKHSLDGCPSPSARFVDGADGTVIDIQTTLTWEKKVQLDGAVDVANLHDADNSYPWSGECMSNASKRCQPTTAAAAACTAGVDGDPTGCTQCTDGDGTCSATDTIWTWVVALNTANFGGHTDWRVPTRDEFRSMIDYADTRAPAVNAAFQGSSCGSTCTNIADAACSCTLSGDYWSSSTYAPDATGAWSLNFFGGDVVAVDKECSGSARAVRGGP